VRSPDEPRQWSGLHAKAVPRLEGFAAWVETLFPDVVAKYFALETVAFPYTLTCSFSARDEDEELLLVQVSIEDQADATTARVDVSTGAGSVLGGPAAASGRQARLVPAPEDEELILSDLEDILDEARRADTVREALSQIQKE
jgi:hypothetical protein